MCSKTCATDDAQMQMLADQLVPGEEILKVFRALSGASLPPVARARLACQRLNTRSNRYTEQSSRCRCAWLWGSPRKVDHRSARVSRCASGLLALCSASASRSYAKHSPLSLRITLHSSYLSVQQLPAHIPNEHCLQPAAWCFHRNVHAVLCATQKSACVPGHAPCGAQRNPRDA